MARGKITRITKTTEPEPAERLAQRLERRHELSETIADSEAAATFASRERLEAEDALREAERARLTGSGDQATVTKAEKALQRAKDAAGQPWGTRSTAARLALRDLDGEISRHIAKHFETFSGDCNTAAELAAERVDAALRAAADAIRERELVAQRAPELSRWVATPTPNLTPMSRAEQLSRDIVSFLERGGERAPVMPISFLPEGAEPEAEPEPGLPSGPAGEYLARALGTRS